MQVHQPDNQGLLEKGAAFEYRVMKNMLRKHKELEWTGTGLDVSNDKTLVTLGCVCGGEGGELTSS